MKYADHRFVLILLAGLALGSQIARAAEPAAGLPNEFFAMDTALFGQGKNPPADEADIAKIAELGYTGLGPTMGGMGGWAGLPQLLSWLDAKHLKLYAIYTGAEVETDQYHFVQEFKDNLQLLKGRDVILWVMIKSKSKPSDPAAFDQAVAMLREVADLAAAQGLRVALYPHANSFCERMADLVRIVEKAGRKNAGVTLNLCHWLKMEGPESMTDVMKLALPHLFVVSINGADRDAKNWIQPLDSGDFDVAAFLRDLHRLGYTGPIGLQGFGVGRTVPPYENLARSMAAWKRLSVAAMSPAPPAPETPAGKSTGSGDDWKAVCARLKTYSLGQNDDADLAALQRCLQHASAAETAQIEAALVALLGDGSVSVEAKQFICRQSPFFHSDAAVSALAKLQAQPQFSFLASFALQRMQGQHASDALRNLLAASSGRQRVDVIRALGVPGDEKVVTLLAPELRNPDRAVATAALGSLGLVGGPAAEKALAAFASDAPAELKPAVAEARLRVAASLSPEAAEKIYREYLKSPLLAARMSALAGLIGPQSPGRGPLLLEVIRGDDAGLRGVALVAARRGGGPELTAGLAGLLTKLPPPQQAAVLDVLAERGDASALPAVLKLADSGEEAVRRAALVAVGRLGAEPQVELLLQAAIREKDVTQTVARTALTLLGGPEVDERLQKLASDGPADRQAEAIGALAARGARSAMPLLLAALESPESAVQQAAISALRTLAGAKEYPELLRRALASSSDAARQRLQGLLLALYARSSQPQQCVAQLVAALSGASAENQAFLLATLGATGDKQALEVLSPMLEAPDVDLRKTAVRSLAEWPDAAPVPQLLTVTRAADQPALKVLALRSIVSILAREKALAAAKKTALLSELLELAPGTAEKRLVIAVLPKAACAESLQLAVKLLADPELADEAAAAIANMAGQRNPPPQIEAALKKAAEAAKSPAVQNLIRRRVKTP